MTPRERVLTAMARQQPDRVPINYATNAGIDSRLKEHFGLSPKDDEGLRRALQVDFRGVQARYRGPRLHADIPSRGVVADNWGVRRRWIANESGGYWDFCDFPLKDADEETVARWPMPSPDDFDYQSVGDIARVSKPNCVFTGNPGLADIINSAGMIRSMEQVLMDLAMDDPACLRYIDRRLVIQYEIAARTIEAARGAIDFLWIGEDLGTQIGPMISRDLFRKHIRPRHQRFVDLAKAFDLPVMIHSCGSSSWAFADFIEMGIDAVDTLQPEAKDMAPRHLKTTFGDRLAFHGCISTAGPVAFGTVEQTVQYCRDTLDIMMPHGGYCFAPTHQLQDNSPAENVLAMYETAGTYGRYGA